MKHLENINLDKMYLDYIDDKTIIYASREKEDKIAVKIMTCF